MESLKSPLRLCYVDGHFAYFTTQLLGDAHGDDWNDAPYEHNAGEPYESSAGEGNKIVKVAWVGPYETPADIHFPNSPYCVHDINRSFATPWLLPMKWTGAGAPIWAGASLDEFKNILREAGGEVYERMNYEQLNAPKEGVRIGSVILKDTEGYVIKEEQLEPFVWAYPGDTFNFHWHIEEEDE